MGSKHSLIPLAPSVHPLIVHPQAKSTIRTYKTFHIDIRKVDFATDQASARLG